jgi:pimeloyl-CoA synthetase
MGGRENMTSIRRHVEGTEERFPTHDEIQKRAHELYLKRGGEHGQDIEDWLLAEGELRQEHVKQSAPIKAKTIGVEQPENSRSADKDLLIAEEERTQVRATEELKAGVQRSREVRQ